MLQKYVIQVPILRNLAFSECRIKIIEIFTLTLGAEYLPFYCDVIQLVTVKFCTIEAEWKDNLAFEINMRAKHVLL